MKIQMAKELDYRSEAVAFLERVYDSRNPVEPRDQFVSQLAKIAQSFPHIALPARETLCGIYEKLEPKVDMAPDMLGKYFSSQLFGETSLAHALLTAGELLYGLKPEGAQLMSAALVAAAFEPVMEEKLDGTMEGFIAAVEENLSEPKSAWACVELYLNYEKHQRTLSELIEPVVKGLMAYEKELIALTEHYFDETYLASLETEIEKIGIRFDNVQMTLKPAFFNYHSLNINSNDDFAKFFGAKPYADGTIGILVLQLMNAQKGGEEQLEDMLGMLRALNDKTRLKILCALKEGPKYTKELLKITGISAATMSHHTTELITRKLIVLERDGASLVYRLAPDTIRQFTALVHTLLIDV